MLARDADAAGEGRIRDGPAATDRRQEIVLADDPVAVLHEIGERTEHLRLDDNRPGAAVPLTSVGIERVTGKKNLHLVVRTDDTASMNYQAHLHRKSSTGQNLRRHVSAPWRISADRALLAKLGALSTIRHESIPMVHALFILSGIGRIL
jgi:hypothetical protein